MFEIRKTLSFEAAHSLPNVPKGHKCSRLHGHSFRVTFVVRGPLQEPLGWVMDYADIKEAVQPLVDQLDHYFLNEISGLENPTSEKIAEWFFIRARKLLPALHHVIVHETCTSECRYPANN